MTSKIKDVIGLLCDIVFTKFHFSRLQCLFFTGVFVDPELAVKLGYVSAIIRNTLLEFQCREMNT